MWPKEYKDYPPDKPLIHHTVEPSHKNIIGCEMHELNGWGIEHHDYPKPRRKGFFRIFLESLFGKG